MVCLKLKSTKEFMQKFLMTEAFADFLLIEAEIDTFVSYTIDGRIKKEFYSKEEQEMQNLPEYAPWESMRPQVVQSVKGKRTPLFMKLVLALSPERAKVCFREDGQASDSESFVRYMLCTVKYENNVITLTGGVSYQEFTMDKSPEKCWDRVFCGMIDGMGLAYELL